MQKLAGTGRFPAEYSDGDRVPSWCRACHREATDRWRAEHPGYDRAYRAARRAEKAAPEEGQRAA
jgi:hypothetical protein